MASPSDPWAMMAEMGFTPDDLANAAQGAMETAPSAANISAEERSGWNSFESFFAYLEEHDGLHSLPGKPAKASEYLDPHHERLDFATLSTWLYYYAATSKGMLADKITMVGCIGQLRNLWSFLQKHNNHQYDKSLLSQLYTHVKDVLSDDPGFANVQRAKTWTSEDGFKDVCRAFWDPEVLAHYLRDRLNMMFYMAIESQTALRVGSMLPKADDKTAATTTWSCFTIAVLSTGTQLVYSPPKGKNEEARSTRRSLSRRSERWEDPVFLGLYLAEMDKALPNDLTAAQLLDYVTLLDGEDRIDLDMKTQAQEIPVFRQEAAFDSPTWSTSRVRDLLRSASFVAGFSSTLTPHGCRRSTAVKKLMEGGSFNDIQLLLGHKLESTVTRKYIQSLVADVAGSVFNPGQEDALDEVKKLLRSNPDKLSAVKEARRLQLSQAGVMKAFEAEEVELARDAFEMTKEDVTEGGIVPIKELDKDSKAKLDKAYYKYNNAFRRARDHQIKVELRLAQDASSLPEQYTKDQVSLPDDAADCGYELLALEQHVSTVQVQSQMLDSLLAPTDPVNSSPEPVSTEDEQTGSEITGIYQHASHPPICTGDTPYTFLAKHLFGDIPTDDATTISLCKQAPATCGSNSFYVPGFIPLIGNLCPGCNLDLEEINKHVTRSDGDQGFHAANGNHIVRCAETTAAARDKAANLARYPATFRHVFQPHYDKNKKKGKPPKTAHAVKFDQMVTSMLGYERKKDHSDGLECFACKEPAKVISLETARSHLLVEHDVWYPPKIMAAKSTTSPDTWDPENTELPAFCVYEALHVITDPKEAEIWHRDLYNRRLIEAAARDKAYGVRPDVYYSAGQIVNDRIIAPCDTKYDLVKRWGKPIEQLGLCFFCAHNDNRSWVVRMKLHRDTGNYATHLKRCAQNMFSSILDLKQDTDTCPGESTAVGHLFFDGSVLACPDPVCRSIGREHDTLLDLAQHICAVHGVDFKERPNTIGQPEMSSLSGMTFETETEVEEWALGPTYRGKHQDQARKKKTPPTLIGVKSKRKENVNVAMATTPPKTGTKRGPYKPRLNKPKKRKSTEGDSGSGEDSPKAGPSRLNTA